MRLPPLSEFQFKELAKYWFDLSKVVLASLVLKFFEPETPPWGPVSLLTIFLGLTFAGALAMLGLVFAKGVKEK